jgi:hypothetical protein
VRGAVRRLRVFQNRVLRRIFGPKRDEVTECWRKLHNEELHSLYSSPDMAQDRDRLRAVVSAVMNLRVLASLSQLVSERRSLLR